MISPQFGHGNLTAWVPGSIILWQLLHFGISMFDINFAFRGFGLDILDSGYLYMLC